MLVGVEEAMRSLALQTDGPKLVIAELVDSARLRALDGIKEHHIVHVTLTLTSNVSFDFLKGCVELRELAIRVMSNVPKCLFSAFSVALPNLSHVTLTNARFSEPFLFSLAKLPLVRVCLEGAEFVGDPTVKPLLGHPKLAYLDIRRVNRHTVKFGRELFMLSRQVPKVEVVADNLIRDRSDYAQLLTKEPKGDGSYAIAKLQKPDWQHPSNQLESLLLVKGREEDSLWENARGISLTHNLCALSSASPIKCPDNRVRIATGEPTGFDTYDFWQYVLEHDVSVIVIVKNHENADYFPHEVGKSHLCRNGGKELIVTCTSKVYDVPNKRTTRLLAIKDKVITHLQMDWEDGYGVEVARLEPFLRDVYAIEKQCPGKTIVHCMGGYGRTGTFFSCMILEQLIAQAQNLSELYLNLEELVRALRQQRQGMIAHPDQLETILEFCQALLRK